MKRLLFFLVVLLFFAQIFLTSDVQNSFMHRFSNEIVTDANNITQTAYIGSSNIGSNTELSITPQVEPAKVTKTKILLDIQKSNVWKITFLSVCAAIIVTVVIVLTIKIHTYNKK